MLQWLPRAGCRNRDPRMFDTVVTRKHREAADQEPSTVIDENVEAAREVCASCPVMMNCLTFAVAEEMPSGVWGGLVVEERTAWAIRNGPAGGEAVAA